MAVLRFYKVAALPAQPESSAFYFVETAQGYTDAWLTDSTGGLHAIGNAQMIHELASESLPSNGSSESIRFEVDAGTGITAGEIIVIDSNGRAIHASSDLVSHAIAGVFVAMSSVLAGQKVIAQRVGPVHGGWQLMPGKPLYLGPNGAITHQNNVGVFQLDVGIALTASSFFFDPGAAIVRA